MNKIIVSGEEVIFVMRLSLFIYKYHPIFSLEKNIENLVQHSVQTLKPDTLRLQVTNFTATHKFRGGLHC